MSRVSILSTLLDVIFPAGEEERLVRSLSESSVHELISVTPLPGGVALMKFREPRVRALIHRAKYANDAHALSLLGVVLKQHLESLAPGALLIPIPLTPSRARERGYNQSETILRNACSDTSHRIATDILLRIRDTIPQTHLSKHARLVNLQGSFAVSPDALTRIADARIILIDDVSTTGATLREARRALLDAGAESVSAIVLAH